MTPAKSVAREDISWKCWVGDGRNRFYGRTWSLGEHSCMDGTLTLRMSEFILSSLSARRVDHGPLSIRTNLPAPKELTFELDGASKEANKAAEAHVDKLVGQHDMEVLHYEGCVKYQIKKHKGRPTRGRNSSSSSRSTRCPTAQVCAMRVRRRANSNLAAPRSSALRAQRARRGPNRCLTCMRATRGGQSCSARSLDGIYNMLLGLLMVRVWIAICLG